MRKNQVTVIDGYARLEGAGNIIVEQDGATVAQVQSDSTVIATGARPRSLPGMEPDGKLIWTYREAMTPSHLPKRLLVVGSGAIGIEFASFYRALGSEVTVVEILPQILPTEDEEISALARKAFEKEGIEIYTDAEISRISKRADELVAVLNTEEGEFERTFDRAILSVGVTGNVEGLGLETTGIQVEKSFIQSNNTLETAEAGVYAIGDVAGPPCLAHKASHEGVICAEHIAGQDIHPLRRDRVPGCTYCHPQIASVGMSEQTARAEGHRVNIGRFPLQASGKAIAIGEPEGLVKTLFDADTGELLGAHMLGPDVTEMIQGFVVALGLETTEAELMTTIFPHPTVSEAMHEAVLDAYGRAINA